MYLVDNKINRGLILLTYKHKTLLMHKSNSAVDPEDHPWTFISGVKDKKESFEQALKRRVEQETGININNVTMISECFYHSELTDENVNQMVRRDNQLLNFFTKKEVDKLRLSTSTKEFIQKHYELI